MRVDLDEVERSLDRTIYLNVPVTQQMIRELRLLRQIDLYAPDNNGLPVCIQCWTKKGQEHAHDCPIKALEEAG